MISRTPIRVGAELYGHAGIECDVELICLMHATLSAAQIDDVSIVLGHVGIFRSLMKAAQLREATEQELFDVVQRKAFDEIDQIVDGEVKDAELGAMLKTLVRLSGDDEVLEKAIKAFTDAPEDVRKELDELVAIVDGVRQRVPDIAFCFDLCELRGYEYHTGIMFAAYTPSYGRAVAKGGRYDHIGEVFGRARRASGFDSDLKTLARLTGRAFEEKTTIVAPDDADAELQKLISELRQQGEVVVTNLGNGDLDVTRQIELNCDRHITERGGKWIVETLETP